MAVITIKDLPQSDTLDREAMRLIVGGGAISARPGSADLASVGQVKPGHSQCDDSRIVDYPPGFGRRGLVRDGEDASKLRI
jgi:hypothetical protein